MDRSALAQLGRMPASIQLKVLSQISPDLYNNPDTETEDVSVSIAPTIPFSVVNVLKALDANGVAVCDGVFNYSFSKSVAAAMQDLELHPGKMGLHWHEESMRGDRFVWLTTEQVTADAALKTLLAQMELWRQEFNEKAGFQLSHCKFMAACYPGKGARYVRHSVRLRSLLCHLFFFIRCRMFRRWYLIAASQPFCI